MGWVVYQGTGTVGELHQRDPPDCDRTIWELTATNDAVVLGSTQRDALLDVEKCREKNIDIVKRRTGGGAVLLLSGDYRWIDVVVRRDDPLAHDDVGRSFDFLGECWAAAARDIGLDARRNNGHIEHAQHGRVLCFAGRGHGEVFVGENKLIGMSQRRTKSSCRFQSVVYERFVPEELLSLLRAGVVTSELSQRYRDVSIVRDVDALVAAFLRRMASIE